MSPGVPQPSLDSPWWCKLSIEFLQEKRDYAGAEWESAFEWGSGGSTVWLAERSHKLTTIEHDPKWVDTVRARLKTGGLSLAEVCLYPLDETYEKAIQGLPLQDLICVDGRRRVECIRLARDQLKPGGYLVLDNSERPRYKEAHDMLSEWEAHNFSNGFWGTTIWRKPE